ncbi:DNA-binding CsgD family transcriptional regulator [Mycobacterium sp. URHB0021]
MELFDRRVECSVLDGVLRDVRSGQSRVLVLYGDPGVGKSALLDYVARQARACRVVRAAGCESEMELAYAALHQVCGPLLDRLERLPPPQRDALDTAFGLRAGPPPDRFLIGLAVLSLFSDAAEEQPLVCLVDDLQWLDRASAQALAFVARRLGAEAVGMIVATRVPHPDLSALPMMQIAGLPEADARALLDAALTAPLDERVRDRIVAETGGNPLALLELPRGFSVRELAGGFGEPGSAPLTAAVQESFRRAVQALPEQTRRLLLLAAAEPLGDPALLWRAAARLNIGAEAAAPATGAELATFGVRVRFRHPLARSAIYRSASVGERQMVHQALAEVTDPDRDPDRRAWHRAQAAVGPDEDVAAELERSAGRARARGGLAAAAAFLEQATLLTLGPSSRAERALAAASAHLDAGAFTAAADLLAVAEGGPLTDAQQARTHLIRARLAFVTDRGNDAPQLLLNAAKRLELVDPALSRATYLEAMEAALCAGRLTTGAGLLEVARAARTVPPPHNPRLSDLVLDGFVAHFTDGYAAGLPILRRAVSAARKRSAPCDEPEFLMTAVAATHSWDDESDDVLTARDVELTRAAGAMTQLPVALSSRASNRLQTGDLAAAEALIHEARAVTRTTGDKFAALPFATLLALRGDQAELSAFIDANINDVMKRGEGFWLTVADFAQALLNNGIGNSKAALILARRAADQPDLVTPVKAAVELVEAAARCGAVEIATDALTKLADTTTASGTDWALGVEARSRALLADGPEAERLYRQAVELSGRTRMRTELARAHLLYGEWLRRRRRRIDARAQLRIAHEMFDAMGMHGFARRARRELAATGETARKRTAATSAAQLTPQEAQVARLAAEGLTNPEIGARLFISAKTVGYHLSKVFTKLDITSRAQLRDVLPSWKPGWSRRLALRLQRQSPPTLPTASSHQPSSLYSGPRPTNPKPHSDWTTKWVPLKVFSDAVAAAMIDRLVHHADVISMVCSGRRY